VSTHDTEAPYYQLAELLYSLGWRPDCDAQYDNLRDNLHKVTAITHPATTRKLRDEFAGRAMQTLLSTEYTSEQVSSEGWPRELAHEAYWIADAMLKARVKPAAS